MKLFKFWNYFTDYANNTTIQGVKYLGEENRHFAEKIFWIISIVICSICCSFTIFQIYSHWDTNPVLMTFSEKPISVTQIPFPAVTICPLTKINRKALNFTEMCNKYKNNETSELTPDQLKKFEAAFHLCFYNVQPEYLKDLESELQGENIINEIQEISLRLNETMIICTWRFRLFPCTSVFNEILTEDGICFTTNMIYSIELIRQQK